VEDGNLIPGLLALAFAAGVQGFLGFGFGIVAMTLLVFGSDLVHTAGVVNVTGIVVTVGMLWRLRSSILWRVAGRLVPFIAIGVVGGVTALGVLDRELMLRTLGAVVIGLASWNLISPRLATREPPLWLDAGVGLIGGVLGGAFNTSGPPVIAHLYRRPEGPDALRGTLQVLFLTVSLLRLPIAAFQGMMEASVWIHAAWGVPAVLVGQALGGLVGRRVPADGFRQVAWAALAVLGAVLLFRGGG
jgi:hypothetical protein